MPTFMRNAYQIKLMTEDSYHQLPSAEARFGALLLSYSRGLFTNRGDGVVDIQSLQGTNVSHLKNAKQYPVQFNTPDLNNYLESGFMDETLEAEGVCALVEMAFKLTGGTTPPYVRGAIRLTPLFHFIDITVSARQDMLNDIFAHNTILKPEKSIGSVEESLYDTPLIGLTNAYSVSGNERTVLTSTNFQEQTDPEQSLTTVPMIQSEELIYLPLAYNIKTPKFKIETKLFDFAPQYATIEYSYNFAPFTSVTANAWGIFDIPTLSVAEGQNILAFRVCNKIGLTNNQYIRIIRSSTPLLVSEMQPEPFAHTNTAITHVGAVLYNAQFVSNNSNASQIDCIKIDQQTIPTDSIFITHGYDNTYRNFASVSGNFILAEGEHSLDIEAHDTYGHISSTYWNFIVDRTAPTLSIQTIAIVSKNIEIQLNTQDAYSRLLYNLTIGIQDGHGHTLYHQPAVTQQAVGDLHYTVPLIDDAGHAISDGTYVISITGYDYAGNRADTCNCFTLDTCAPTLSVQMEHILSGGSPTVSIHTSASEPVTVIAKCNNIDRDTVYPIMLNTEPTTESIYTLQLKQAGLSEGDYIISFIANDAAGNQSEIVTFSLQVRTTPPNIYGQHAAPMVVNQNSGFATTIYAQVTTNSGNQPVHGKLQVTNKSTGVVTYSKNLEIKNDIITEFWIASDERGVYVANITVTDRYGNTSNATCEIIKEGIAPVINFPTAGQTLGGIVGIIGSASDSDWTNSFDFDHYILYWAYGEQSVPADLKNIDPAIWQTAGLEVPFINRKDKNNISYRAAVADNTLLGYFNTQKLPDGTYTLLVVSCEQTIGATGSTTKTIIIDNTDNNSGTNPYAALTTKPNTLNFIDNSLYAFSIFNAYKDALVNLEVVKQNGQTVKYINLGEIKSAPAYGQPQYIPGTTEAVYVWQDASSWHLRINSKNQPLSCNITLCGVDTVIHNDMPYTFKNGIVSIKTTQATAQEQSFDFTLNAETLYIECLANNQTIADIAQGQSLLRIGGGKQQPEYSPTIISAGNSNCIKQYTWDGLTDYGAYVDSGTYTIRITAGGTDGSGYAVSETTVNIQTPFTVQNIGMSPTDGQFDAFNSPINAVTAKYIVNKDIHATAVILDQAGTTISVLTDQDILGSKAEKNIIWNGAYPTAESNSRVVSGTYTLRVILTPQDTTTATVLNYGPITLQQPSGSAGGMLNPLGTSINYNGSVVNATEGLSNYLWLARGTGTYTVPKTVTFSIVASGNQTVTVKPFVPFAGLYHRGFNKVKVKLDTKFHFKNDGSGRGCCIILYDQSNSKGYLDTPGQQHIEWNYFIDKSYYEITNEQQTIHISASFREINRNNKFSSNKCYGDTSIIIYSTDGAIIDRITDIHGGWTGPGEYTGASEKGIFGYTVSISRGDQNYILQANISIKLLDAIAYSRLTNRYYAWYGYVNKDTGRSLKFSEWFTDLGKLGFVPSSYFENGYTKTTINALLAEKYPVTIDTLNATITKNQKLIAALSKANVQYDTLHCTDNSYYTYLDDEYTEFIPMATAQGITFNITYSSYNRNIIESVRVDNTWTTSKIIPWPIKPEDLISTINMNTNKAVQLAGISDIQATDYNNLPYAIDLQTVNFSNNTQELSGTVSRKQNFTCLVQSALRNIPSSNVNMDNTLKIRVADADDPDIEILFDNGQAETIYSSTLNVTARYKSIVPNSVQQWSTQQDAFLKNGLIESLPVTFNANGFAPISEKIYIGDTYFAENNRVAGISTQNIFSADFLTFRTHDYYDANSGRILNPNLDISSWNITLHDVTGKDAQDLEAVNINNGDTYDDQAFQVATET